MICPHCNYEHGWSGEALDTVEGQHGDFYQLGVKIERAPYDFADRKELYACPSCKKTFIG